MRINPPIAQTRDKVNYAGTSTGSANTQLLSGVTAYQDGMIIEFQSGYTNTGPMTLNGKAVQLDGAALTAYQVQANEVLRLRYDGTAFQILRPRVSANYVGAQYHNCVLRTFQFLSMGSGDTDLYTPPSNKCGIPQANTLTNQSGGAITGKYQFKIGSTYYPTTTGFTILTGAGKAEIAATNMPICDSTMTMAVNTTASGACLVCFGVYEFDDTSPAQCAMVIGLVNGGNLVKTCPAGYTMQQLGLMTFSNGSAGSRTWYPALVAPSGSLVTPGAGSNALYQTGFPVAAAAVQTTGVVVAGSAGFSLYVATDSSAAGQVFWWNHLLIPID